MQDQENQAVDQHANAAAEPLIDSVAAEAASEEVSNLATEQAKLIASLEMKLAEMQDAFMRAKADGENIRRRAQEDISKAHKFAIEGFAEAMVPVKDSLEMALKVETPSIDSLKEGVEMTLKQLSSAFEKNRLLEINPQAGEKLDPMKHQAISMVPAEQDANTVVTVLQKGYNIADRLLRPALVTVAQAK
ncbi:MULTISPECIES: nucleotide exchange factor GrpE [unclassified Undibacterium]|uniref:nucleotide exchange factor GrpE n=1 Tax=unclassified Undibacterium TaxID=2630295 RepID=UPI002AC9D96C|nr:MULTISPECIES: nucleotide exchange factor GrpE [unclassified Undibacterium]MEB0139898.1 nucleotide exchange factor GrpE [Undibacterium sp. CCC2.1]MEB0171833.1 nucleotide exchange factor GrpE [Undibacterium sp. CCC1.1]MEB0175649.1 nucleotide exchange factor GrpE [Undibacterium sp. CCC3.4]MEB0216231.1 nucleotide exchange factor GrpE [Undibacterium sp. 5I2]WPX44124.1 nucleotide exchange factor GrpE [Undibacterium sp. CCC3.4]